MQRLGVRGGVVWCSARRPTTGTSELRNSELTFQAWPVRPRNQCATQPHAWRYATSPQPAFTPTPAVSPTSQSRKQPVYSADHTSTHSRDNSRAKRIMAGLKTIIALSFVRLAASTTRAPHTPVSHANPRHRCSQSASSSSSCPPPFSTTTSPSSSSQPT